MSTARTDVPVTPFHESSTCRSLQEILQHKQCARCHYLQAAEQTEADGFYVISHAFRFTAAQEAEQAAVLQGLLRSHGISAAPTAQAQPLPHSPLALLRTAAEHEHTAWGECLPRHAAIAEREGFHRIAAALRRIAETDQLHARRFARYMEALANGSLLQDEHPVSWVCLACGHLHSGCAAPLQCTNCSGTQGHFIRSSFYPFAAET